MTSVPDGQILAASRQDGRRKQPEARSCFIARTAYRFVDVLSAGGGRLDSRIGVGGLRRARPAAPPAGVRPPPGRRSFSFTDVPMALPGHSTGAARRGYGG